MDILCTHCDETWNTIADGLDQEEVDQMLSDKGCPNCIDNPDNEIVSLIGEDNE